MRNLRVLILSVWGLLVLVLPLVLTPGFGAVAGAAESAPVKSGRAVAQLVSSYDVVAPGQEIEIGLYMRLEPHWHTYWRNAGGPGNPVEMEWRLPDGARIGEIVWPLPKIVHTGPIVNYAFEDRLLLPMSFHVPETAKTGDVLSIGAEARYLVCYQVCLPEQADLSLELKVGTPLKDTRWAANLARVIRNAPKTEGLTGAAALRDGQLVIDIAGENFDPAGLKNPYFFPYEQDVIDASAPQKVERGTHGIRFVLKPDYALEKGIKDVPGVLAFDGEDGQRRGIVVAAKAGASVDIGSGSGQNPAPKKPIGFWAAMIGAFLGGLILNLMPCVFPVLSLKALGFARAAHHDKGKIRRHGWLYTLGVMVSFLGLAGLVIALKAAGAGIGWGFQLQSPFVIGLLALLFFAIALNLFGLFEVGGALQNTGAGLTRDESARSAFFTGVLAVIVATPCTAPFMAGALGFAFTQPLAVTLVIFAALGAGLALPFLLLAHMPGLLKRLPKPGAWMETFKQLLAFPMLGAAIWLVWVLAGQTGAGGVVRILSAMLAVGFAVWIWRYKNNIARLLFALALGFALWSAYELRTAAFAQKISADKQDAAWSHEAVAKARAEGHVVFVDFTAAWCVSCQANDRLVLSRAKTKELFRRTGTKVLIADWTNRDALIAKELERFGRSGVPLYLVYPAGTDSVEPQILPQVLTYGIVEKAIEKARALSEKSEEKP
ncbi:MAG TPA: thiol:disulfide interchange protein [Hellea balneolensis]|uniref:Thiol:disulfide interchange protein n=1 Tax=Hellea balneolensis TaxID=287478 RepID=A0A7V5NW26_9PROT|nr:thiol:disulfide interchange protein [Hellea balneolensis]